MRNKKKAKKVTAAVLASVLAAGSLTPAVYGMPAKEPVPAEAQADDALEQPEAIHIASADDLRALSDLCILDSWSEGKYVVLDCDISLDGELFSPIAVFGGIFDGQGHTISGLQVDGSGKDRGMFRYLLPGSLLKNLTVKGECLSKEQVGINVGGLAGQNEGTIIGCRFEGTVSGADSVGGLVGVNEESGQVADCSFSGEISGSHYAGGIAGQSFGILKGCLNEGKVNTVETQVENRLEDMNWTRLNSAENMPVSTDAGGVTGFSTGMILDCKNTGSVGYAHVGYNVGGIVGRQAGFLRDCENTGTVLGRKDVGGIAGQLEPAIQIKYEKDTLKKLEEELDQLKELTDQALDNSDRISDSVEKSLNEILNRVDTVRTATEELADAASGWADDSISEINEFSSRAAWAMEELVPVLRQSEDALWMAEETGNRLFDALDAFDSMEGAGSAGAVKAEVHTKEVAELREACDRLKEAQEAYKTSGEKLRQDLEAFLTGDKNDSQLKDRLEESIRQWKQAIENLKAMVETVKEVLNRIPAIKEAGEESVGHLKDAASVFGTAMEELSEAVDDGTDILETLSNEPAIEIPSIEKSVSDKGDSFQDALKGLSDEMRVLTELMGDSTDTVSSDLRAIKRQFETIVDVAENGVKEERERDTEDRFEDLSAQEDPEGSDSEDMGQQTNTGRILSCVNQGQVSGDVNVAGIVGSMAIEYDFDPEDDLIRAGDSSLNFRYQTLAVVENSKNLGQVTAKKNYAGGISGRMDLGRISGCENSGEIESKDGSYVGGIAGCSKSLISDSWAKGILSGEEFVGGIAGYGDTVKNCHAMVEIAGDAVRTGAIAGDRNQDGTFSENTFAKTDTVRAAVDGVSLTGQAEPVTFAALLETEGAPEDIGKFSVTFMAGDKVVTKIPFSYGGGIGKLPKIPARAGYTASWPQLDYGTMYASRTVDARYMPVISALASEETDENGRPLILAEGTFESGETLSCIPETVTITDRKGKTREATAYTVSISQASEWEPSGQEREFLKIHYRTDKNEKPPVVYLKEIKEGETEVKWIPIETTMDGSYLVFEGDARETVFAVVTPDKKRTRQS